MRGDGFTSWIDQKEESMNNELTNARLVKVMTYGSSHVAHTAKGLLTEHGITAQVQGDMISDAFSYYGTAVSRTDIVTLEADAERAVQILRQMELEAKSISTGPWSDGPTLWLCNQCEEQNAHTFDHCWSCHADRPANPRTIPVETIEDEPTTYSEASFSPIEANDSPYRSPGTVSIPIKNASSPTQSEKHAAKVAILSCVLFPLGFYGLYVTLRCISQSGLSWKIAGIFAANVLACLASLFILLPPS